MYTDGRLLTYHVQIIATYCCFLHLCLGRIQIIQPINETALCVWRDVVDARDQHTDRSEQNFIFRLRNRRISIVRTGFLYAVIVVGDSIRFDSIRVVVRRGMSAGDKFCARGTSSILHMYICEIEYIVLDVVYRHKEERKNDVHEYKGHMEHATDNLSLRYMRASEWWAPHVYIDWVWYAIEICVFFYPFVSMFFLFSTRTSVWKSTVGLMTHLHVVCCWSIIGKLFDKWDQHEKEKKSAI